MLDTSHNGYILGAMKAEAKVRFDLKDYALIKKAAKAEHRSLSQFVALSAVDAAKAALAVQKFPPSSASPQEAVS